MANALLDLILQSQQPEHQGLRNALLDHMISQNVIDARSTPGMQHPYQGWGGGKGDLRQSMPTRGLKQDLGSGVNYGAMDPYGRGWMTPQNSGRQEGQMTQDDWRKVISDWYQNRVQGMR